MKRYYLYAGYYELWISDKILRRPLTPLGWHKSLRAAVRHAEKSDPDATLCFDRSLMHEVREEFAYLPWQERDDFFPFFRGENYDIRKGLSDLTVESLTLPCTGDCRVSPEDTTDIARFLQTKTKRSYNSLYADIAGRKYSDVRGMVKPYLVLSS